LENTGRRRILLVYVHGFMGNESSFRSFPAHVHNLVSVTLADTHVVHTKIYPRYQARYSLEQARDQFSTWYVPWGLLISSQTLTKSRLAPHEDKWTDVILLGHSMGGLLSADVALLFRHRIIGVLNFDVPFVGMHPGIIKAGLGSIFTKVPPPQDQILTSPTQGSKPSRMSTIFNPKPTDPNYNPSFANDVHLPVRKGLDNALHWFNKHSNNIKEAGKGLVKSHIEFGGAMADYKQLKDRYARIRALEEDNEMKRRMGNPDVKSPPRIRFINYYTASTGRPKKPKSPKSPSSSRSNSVSQQHHNSDVSGLDTESQHDLSKPTSDADTPPLTFVEAEQYHGSSSESDSGINPLHDTKRPVLPDIPAIPQEPQFVDTAQIADRSQRRAAEREYDEALEEYHKAVKARNRIINEREDIEEEWEQQQQQQQQQKQQKALAPVAAPAAKPANPPLTGEALRLAQEEERMAREKARLEGREHHAPVPDAPPLAPQAADGGQDTPGRETPNLSADVHNLQLGASRPHHPYSNYSFSRSAILKQPSPDDAASVTDSAYTATTTNSTDTNPSSPSSSSCNQTQKQKDKKAKQERKEREKADKAKKLGKFCMLPPKDSQGHKDPTWVKVYMEGMDEVAAHTSLFFVNETYERLVGDVGARVEEWVREADSERVVRELSGMA
jgi:pimeloyl-ACP methyl ester carboxylesterase